MYLEARDAYDCHGCGDCCRADWNIAVEPSVQSVIQEWKPGYLSLRVNQSGATSLAKDAHGCVFLQNSRCGIHAELGEAHKPLACRTFPYVLLETPVGLFVRLSYFCPSVRQRRGRLLSEQRSEVEVVVREAALPAVMDGPFRVVAEVTTGWTGYLVWEEALAEHWRSGAGLEAARRGLHQHGNEWGRRELDDYFPAQADDPIPSPETAAYLWSLIHGKLLLRQPDLLQGLELLCQVRDRLALCIDWDREVVELELQLTHGSGRLA